MIAIITHTLGVMEIMKREQVIAKGSIKPIIYITILNLIEALYTTLQERMYLKNNSRKVQTPLDNRMNKN